MKILFRNSKWIVFGLAIFFMGFFTINYIDLKAKQINSDPIVAQENKEDLIDLDFKKEAEVKHLNQKLIESIKPESIITTKQTSKQQQRTKKRYIAYDGGGFGSVNSGVTKCADGLEVEVVGSNSQLSDADILYFHMGLPHNLLSVPNKEKNRQYTMVFAMESEPHSYGGDTWLNADFRMWYNLDLSFPEPATYFENKMHLADLLSPAKVEFENKEKSAHIVWVVSNCNAYNAREKYMQKLMDKLQVDSYGGCLKNKFSHPAEHMSGNIELFSRYKFVIAIENSNCQDYITEKLVHAVASGSIPIVAGKDNKPDYLKFMPKDSYINIYDYKTIDDLVAKIKSISSNKTEYESYIKFKKSHNYTREYLYSLKLNELIQVAKTVIDPKQVFFSQLIEKEKSENKLCKIARYLNNTPKETVDKEIKEKKISRPDSAIACLLSKNLVNDFK